MAVAVAQDVGPASLTAASSTTITQVITIAAGSRIHAAAVGDTGTAASATFSDNSGQGVAWTSHSALNISNFRMFNGTSKQFPTGGTITVTCTFASAMSDRGLVLQEITGADNNAVQDAQGQTQNPVSAGTDVVTTPSLTGTGAGGLAAFTRTNGGSNVSAGTGFTGGTARWTGSGDASMPEFKVTSGGSVAATWSTTAGGGAWWSVGVIFSAASAGGTGVTVDNQDTSVRRPPRRQPDQAQALPPALASPWVFVEPPRVVRPRRQEPQQAIPLPPLVAATAAAFAPQAEALARASPRRQDASVVPVPALAGPVPVAGLKLWLRGDLGISLSGPNVVTWADQSGCGNDVTGSILYNPSSINGKAGLTFAGTSAMTNTTSSPFAAGGARTVFIVARATSEVGGPLFETFRASGVRATFFQGGSAYTPFPGGIYTDSVNGARNATISSPTLTGVPMIIQFTIATMPASVTMKINGVTQSVTQGSPCDAETGSAGFGIGFWGAGASFYVGDIDEALGYDGVLPAGDEAAAYAYLAARYLLTPWVQVDQAATRRPRPALSQNADAIPPMSSPAIVPFSAVPDAVRPRARRLDQLLSANPLPPATRSGPTVEIQPARRLVRSIVNAIREFVGLPALLPPPPAELKLKPPLWAVFDEVSLTAETDAVVLSATADEVTLDVESDT